MHGSGRTALSPLLHVGVWGTDSHEYGSWRLSFPVWDRRVSRRAAVSAPLHFVAQSQAGARGAVALCVAAGVACLVLVVGRSPPARLVVAKPLRRRSRRW